MAGSAGSGHAGIQRSFSPLLCFRATGSAEPLFFLHGVTGDAERFRPLAARIDPDRPVYGIQAQGFDPDATPLIKLEDLAAYYLQEVKRVQPRGPYFFVGYSFGGMLAFEMAQQLAAEGERVALLGMVDAPDMSFLRGDWGNPTVSQRISTILNRLSAQLRTALRMQGRLAHLMEKLKTRALREIYGIYVARGLDIPRIFRSATDLNYFAAIRYDAKEYEGSVVLFRAAQEEWSERLPRDLGWGRVAKGGIEILDIPGRHYTAFEEPSVSVLMEHVSNCLARNSSLASAPVVAQTDIGAVERRAEVLSTLG